MKKCDMPYALSVFLPECGLSHEILDKNDIVEVLGLQHDEYIKSMGETTPLLLDLVEQIKSNCSVRPNLCVSAT
jgi:LisH